MNVFFSIYRQYLYTFYSYIKNMLFNKNCKSPLLEISKESRPQSVDQIQKTMEEMDRRYSTCFLSFIQSETNANYISTLKKSFIREQMDECKETGILVLRWITREWALTTIAPFLLKLFSDMSISSLFFIQVVEGITETWNTESLQGKVFFKKKLNFLI